MVIIAKKEDVINLLPDMYEIALVKEKSSFPTFTDKIKTKTDFINVALNSFSCENEEILLYNEGGNTCGWIHYSNDNGYISVLSILNKNNNANHLTEFLQFISNINYKEIYVGMCGENTVTCKKLESLGFKKVEELNCTSLLISDYKKIKPKANIIKINLDNYDLFEKIHKQKDMDFYWNSARIKNNINNWNIYVCVENQKALAAIYSIENKYMHEIFGIDFLNKADLEVSVSLINSLIIDVEKSNKKHLTYFCEDFELNRLIESGFIYIGKYINYTLQLKE